MMHRTGLSRGPFGVGLAVLAGEDGDQPAIARIEIEMAFRGSVEIGLFEDEGHAKHAFPEVDRSLPVCPHQRNVVDTLCLQSSHRRRLLPRPVFTHGVQSGDVDTPVGVIWTRTDRPSRHVRGRDLRKLQGRPQARRRSTRCRRPISP
jgi:hypothetical protein